MTNTQESCNITITITFELWKIGTRSERHTLKICSYQLCRCPEHFVVNTIFAQCERNKMNIAIELDVFECY